MKALRLFVVALVACSPLLAVSQVAYYPGTGHYYELVTGTGQISWTTGRNLAASRSYNGWPGHLVTITSSGEEAFLNSLGDLVFMWTGGVQAAGSQEPAGGWGWSTEEPFAYTDWAPGEPNDDQTSHGNENRILFKNAGSPGSRPWMDIPEDGGFATIQGYIVEYEPPLYIRWKGVLNPPPTYVGLAILLTDGTVMCAESDTGTWWRLTPDIFGSYENGTWSATPSLPSGYGPQYAATAVLADGRVVCVGGEYNFSSSPVWTRLGAIYDPVANTWTSLPGPSIWSNVGDAQSCVLPDGRLMIANPFDNTAAVLNPTNLTWSSIGTGKVDGNDEEGWTLLPDGTVLTVDVGNSPNAEKFVPSTNSWISAGTLPQSLVDASSGEIGPAVLLANGTVFATGATSHNAIYTPGATPSDPGSWASAPDWPSVNGAQTHIADGPACLLTNGKVLCCTSPGLFTAPDYFFEFDGSNLNQVQGSPRAMVAHSSHGSMLTLPTGQVLFTDYSTDVEIYNPSGNYSDSWRPTVTASPTVIGPGETFILQGTQLNGLSQCSGYGDDVQTATNYPLVRITNVASGHVQYARTHDHSTMAVATGSGIVSTFVTLPPGLELGAARLEVIANGIPSLPVQVTVSAALVTGQVALGNWSASRLYVPVRIEIRAVGSTTPLDAQTVLLDAQGNFQMATSLPAGNYDIAVKGSHWLRQVLANQTIHANGLGGLSFSLLNGDIDGNNAVGLSDFARLKSAFGSLPGNPNWNPNADLDGNGAVGLSDFAILKLNFGRIGDP